MTGFECIDFHPRLRWIDALLIRYLEMYGVRAGMARDERARNQHAIGQAGK